ncbi:MAG: gamma-butyrobetaine hydroxylase-like domain-containing protein, partial [Bdellovibrionota bacterium]
YINMPSLKQSKIERLENRGIRIEWPEVYSSILLPVELLRSNCPCALCREMRGEGNHDTPLTPKKSVSRLQVISHSRDEELNLQRIWSIGNYAIGIQWGDGHDDGIYTFALLRELTEKAKDGPKTREQEDK